jgi:hypothetical protein
MAGPLGGRRRAAAVRQPCLIVLVILAFCATRAAVGPRVELRAVVPRAATVGSRVQLIPKQVNGLYDFLQKSPPRVFFGGKPAELMDVDGTTIVVKVPKGVALDAKITGTVGPLVLAPVPFTVIPQIVGLQPETAKPGDTVTAYLDVIIPERFHDKLELRYFSEPATVGEIGRSSVVFTVPESAVPGSKPELWLKVGDVESPTYMGLRIEARPSPPQEQAVSSKLLLIVAPIAILLGLSTFLLWRRYSRLRELTSKWQPSTSPGASGQSASERTPVTIEEAVPEGPVVPEIPPKLVERILDGDCVLFAGGGVAAPAGFPTWEQDLANVMVRLVSTSENDDQSKNFLTSLQSARPSEAIDVLAERPERSPLLAHITGVYGQGPRDLPEVCGLLASIPFRGVLTTNWDDTMVETFRGREGAIVLPRDWEQFTDLLRLDKFFVLRFHGAAKDPESIVLTASEYQRTLEENAPYRKFLTSLYTSKTIFFLGSSLDSIEQFVSGLRLAQKPPNRHYALVPRTPGFTRHQHMFDAKYGIEVLGYGVSTGHPQMLEFVRGLQEAVSARRDDRPRHQSEKIPTLDRVILENIGPFKSLDIELGPGWNILLGNNGCGKSTVLKAIALGLCGDDDRVGPAAADLLRHGAVNGYVELRVGEAVYRTELLREGPRVRVRSRQLTPLQTGQWLVLGFPVLRGVSSSDPRRPDTESDSLGPQVDDVLPLLHGVVDTRMDDVKQWIYNCYVRSTTRARKGHADDEVKRIFDFLQRMTPGILLEFHKVDEDTLKLLVRTNDGVLPLDLLSQGTSSVIGWVGTLLRRMFAVYGDTSAPAEQPALVVIDEVAAHMHPEWQYQIGKLIRENFPKLQLLAATHSPLVVADMDAEDVLIARRDAEQEPIRIERAPMSFEGLRADQILTSPLFGLATTRGSGTRRDIARYSKLLGKKERSSDEEEEFKTLRARLNRTLKSGETEHARRVEEEVERTLASMYGADDAAKKLHEAGVSELEIRQRLRDMRSDEGGSRDSA